MSVSPSKLVPATRAQISDLLEALANRPADTRTAEEIYFAAKAAEAGED